MMSRGKIIELEEGWEFIQKGITKLKKIREGEQCSFSSEEYMMYYTYIYNMCIQKPPHNYSPQLLEKYKETFEEHINFTVLPALRKTKDEFMLRELVLRWEDYKLMVMWLSEFLHYLDGHFIVEMSLPTLNEHGLICFRKLVYVELGKARDATIVLIDQERDGEQIERALLKKVIDIFVGLGMGKMDYYENNFEDAMLKDTAAYYSQKASSWILEDSCSEYMFKVEDCLKKEKNRVSHYLHISSETKLLAKVQQELLVAYSNKLLKEEHTGFRAFLRDDKVEDLSRMYRLFHRIPKGLQVAADMFKEHVTAEGMVLVQQAEDTASNKVFVSKLIELNDKCVAYVTDCFAKNPLFSKALKVALDVLCNKNVSGCSSAELFASYCDNIFKKAGRKNVRDNALEDKLDKVLDLLKFNREKDLFAEFYRKKFSSRFLFYEIANDDHERLILKKLKEKCGKIFTLKMEQMVTDMALAKENQNQFQEYLSNNPAVNPGIVFNVTLLRSKSWPTYESSDLSLPVEMVKCVEVFEKFYQLQNKDKNLNWIYSLGKCKINGNFESQTIELTVGTYQAAALLLFNASDRLSYSDIKSRLNLADDDLIRVLQSLSCAEYKILTKEPSNDTVSSSDHFGFNSKFTATMRRIRVSLPRVDEREKVVDERKKVIEDVDKDRRYAIRACIIRIMKNHKVVHHKMLVSECDAELSLTFKPDVKAIKTQIDDLITLEYLERDKENPDLFRYIP